MTRRTPLSLALICAFGAPGLALAQAAADNGDAQTITITAQGRTQVLQSVPIAVQVISTEQIEKLAATNVGDLNGYIPGLNVDASEPTQPNFSLRGVGNTDFGIGTDAPVGVYVNGVYAGKTGGALLNFNDVKRIEVLKGPQGTLFGRNSAGGAIAVITNDPTSSFAASGLFRLGNQGTRHVEAMVNQPLGDSFALRVSLVDQHSDGWVRNADTGQWAGGNQDWGTRMSLRWSVSDDTSAVLSWEHEQLNQRARPVWSTVSNNPTDAADAVYVDPRKQPLRNDAAIDNERRRYDGITLRIAHSLPFGELTSTTAYRRHDTRNLEDNDGTDRIESYLSTGNFDTNRTWQQEFRLSGKNATVDWLGGVSYYSEKSTQTSQVNTTTDALDYVLSHDPTIGVPPFATLNGIAQAVGVPGINLLGQSWQENMNNTGDYKAWAVYGDAIWHLGESTNLTTGVRFTHDDKKFTWYNPLRSAPGLDPQLAVFTPDFFNALVGAGAIDPGTAGLLGQLVQGLQFTNVEFTNPASFSAPLGLSKSWNDVSPRLVLDHRYSPDLMVYASVTRGYQAGGFNAVNTQANQGSFDPEHVISYELGAKGGVRSMGLSYSASLFHYDFTNLQSVTLNENLTVPTYQVTVSDVKATGLDIEGNWRATRQLRLFGAAELIDQTYKRQNNPIGHDLTGQPYGTPRVSATAGLDYVWPAAQGQADFTLQAAYTGAQRCNDNSTNDGNCLTTPAFTVGGARTRVDTRLGWEAPEGKWGVALVVNNLLDQRYINWVSNLSAPVGVPFYAGLTPPRSFAVEFKARL